MMMIFKRPYCRTEYEMTTARLSFQRRSYANATSRAFRLRISTYGACCSSRPSGALKSDADSTIKFLPRRLDGRGRDDCRNDEGNRLAVRGSLARRAVAELPSNGRHAGCALALSRPCRAASLE
jgi:hypothetical protein